MAQESVGRLQTWKARNDQDRGEAPDDPNSARPPGWSFKRGGGGIGKRDFDGHVRSVRLQLPEKGPDKQIGWMEKGQSGGDPAEMEIISMTENGSSYALSTSNQDDTHDLFNDTSDGIRGVRTVERINPAPGNIRFSSDSATAGRPSKQARTKPQNHGLMRTGRAKQMPLWPSYQYHSKQHGATEYSQSMSKNSTLRQWAME